MMTSQFRNATLLMIRDTAGKIGDLMQNESRELELVARVLHMAKGEVGLETDEEKLAYLDLVANIDAVVKARSDAAEKLIDLGQVARMLIQKARIRDELAAQKPSEPAT